MKPDIENTNPDHHSSKPRRPKYREVSSRFLSPPSSSTAASAAAVNDELSTLKFRPSAAALSAAADARIQAQAQDNAAQARRVWPSTSPSTLACQIGKEKKDDVVIRRSDDMAEKFASLGRQKSSTEFKRFENDNYQGSKISRKDHSQQHMGVFGGSMRYTGKLFSKKSSKTSSYNESPSSVDDIVPRRMSVNENAYPRRSPVGNSDSEFSASSTNSLLVRPKKTEVTSRSMSFDHSPKKKKSTKLKRASSMMTVFGSTTSKWAMSPGRSGSPPMTVENKGVLPMSFSSMKPPTSPSKGNRTKGVGSLFSKGFDLIKGKNKSGIYSSSPSPLGATATTSTDTIHQLRINHNRLMQWRYANAKANDVNKITSDKAKSDLIAVSDSVRKLQHSVVKKRIQLEKEKLQMKLYYVLRSQMESLKAWGDLDRQHTSAVSTTKDCLHSVICRVPLVEGAKMDPHSSSFALRHASDLTISIKSMLSTNPTEVENTSTVCSELAEVVAQEKALLQEFSELFKFVSKLEEEERSLKCCLILMKANQQQQEIK